ncbi:MAG: T9SS type A sorting domain-containing protein, partial [Caldisericaceae bacterium]|nr:T9SS type A sorting domain-containing protein [Caldisericaceae bacterium]
VKMNFTDSKALSYGLGNIYRDEKQDEALVKSLTTSQMLPEEAVLFANYPNPFNPTTNIRFALPKDGSVKLEIYNLNGQRIKELINGDYQAGYHSVKWDGKDEHGRPVSSGMYFYVLKTSKITESRKMFLLK